MRTLSSIANDIYYDWGKVAPSAKPYLDAMAQMYSVSDKYGCEDGRSIVLYFLSNATGWQGEKAKKVKQELREGLKQYTKVSRERPADKMPAPTGDWMDDVEESDFSEEDRDEEE